MEVAPDAAWLIGVFSFEIGDMAGAKKAFDFAIQKYPDAKLRGRLRTEMHADLIKKANEAAAKGEKGGK